MRVFAAWRGMALSGEGDAGERGERKGTTAGRRDKSLSPNSRKPLTWLGFWRAGRSGRVPRLLICSAISMLFPALCRNPLSEGAFS